jgi:molecular chaperone HtpG
MRQRRILELNAGHALVQGLRRRFDANPNDPVVGDYAELLLGWSLLAEGSEPHDPVRFTQLMAGLMETGLESAPAAAASHEPGAEPAEGPSAPEGDVDAGASEPAEAAPS